MIQAWCVCDAPFMPLFSGGRVPVLEQVVGGELHPPQGGRVKVLQRIRRDLILLLLSQTDLQIWSCNWTAAVPNQN